MTEAGSEETYAMLQSFSGLIETEVATQFPKLIVKTCTAGGDPPPRLNGDFFFGKLTSRVGLKRQLRAVLKLTTEHPDAARGELGYVDPELGRMFVSRSLTTQY